MEMSFSLIISQINAILQAACLYALIPDSSSTALGSRTKAIRCLNNASTYRCISTFFQDSESPYLLFPNSLTSAMSIKICGGTKEILGFPMSCLAW